MANDNKLSVKAFWDLDCVPAGEVSERGLLLRVDAQEIEQSLEPEKSLNLAVVIDASASMRDWRLEAAKQAVTGIIEHLSDGDRLSIISFSNDVRVHIDGSLITPVNKDELIQRVSLIYPRGMTDLGSGWLRGAEAVANFLDDKDFHDGNVVVLSDGRANQGMVDPGMLSKHSSELLARGITTSCIGIGDDYSPLQLDAIAEAGGGRLHDSTSPDEIIEVLLGELVAAKETVASSVEVELLYAANTMTEVLTRLPAIKDEGSIRLQLGAMSSGCKRENAFLVEVPPGSIGEVFNFEFRVHWTDPKTGERLESPWEKTFLTVIDPLQYQERIAERDMRVANKIAQLWQSGLIYESIRLNENGQYQDAGDVIDHNILRMKSFVHGLDNGNKLIQAILRVGKSVRSPWNDKRRKRDSFVASKKMMKNEVDYRSRRPNDWRDHL